VQGRGRKEEGGLRCPEDRLGKEPSGETRERTGEMRLFFVEGEPGEAEEKRQKPTRTTGSYSRQNPIQQIWVTRSRIGRLETFRATWTGFLGENPARSVELK